MMWVEMKLVQSQKVTTVKRCMDAIKGMIESFREKTKKNIPLTLRDVDCYHLQKEIDLTSPSPPPEVASRTVAESVTTELGHACS